LALEAFAVGPAEQRRTPVVDVEDGPAAACPVLAGQLEARPGRPGRAAVREHLEWRQGALRGREAGVAGRVVERVHLALRSRPGERAGERDVVGGQRGVLLGDDGGQGAGFRRPPQEGGGAVQALRQHEEVAAVAPQARPGDRLGQQWGEGPVRVHEAGRP